MTPHDCAIALFLVVEDFVAPYALVQTIRDLRPYHSRPLPPRW